MTAALPIPSFVDRDPAQITADMVAEYEARTGRTLHPAQVERLLIDLMAYRESLVRIAIQEAALQNLLAFARFPMLDYLGEYMGTPRLPARAATTQILFILSSPAPTVVIVPAGTRVQATDGRVSFATDVALMIPPGASFGVVAATATTVGEIGNGYAAGAISAILDPVTRVASAANTDVTDGGADVEDDDRYRERVRQAPARFSVAGSAEAYRFHALSASSRVADVAVTNPLMGVVRLYVLGVDGLPSAQLLSDVHTALSNEKVRPLSDTVEVVAPVSVPFAINATVRPVEGADVPAVKVAAEQAAANYASRVRGRLGHDIVPSQIVAALSVSGVYSVTLSSPAAERVVAPEEWANCTSIVINMGASANG